MNTLNLKKYNLAVPLSVIASIPFLLLAWLMVDGIGYQDITIGTIDPGILQVIALAFAVWLVLLAITMAIIGMLLSKIILQINHFFHPVKPITAWQQHVLYLALFALLLLSGTGCLMAIC
jgi:hypothetical protein